LAQEVWELTVCELLLDFRFLDLATGIVKWEVKENIHPFGIDGECIYYNSKSFLNFARKGQVYVNRAYLHMILHGLFYHLFQKRDGRYWNVACDIAVEYVLDHLNSEKVKIPLSEKRREWYDRLENQPLTAETIEFYLEDNEVSLEELESIFQVDDHSSWIEKNAVNEKIVAGLQQNWQNFGFQIKKKKENQKSIIGKKAGGLSESIVLEEVKRQDYRKFLENYMSTREDVLLDLESFDYISYIYGLEHYENMPFIEPLEYKEVTRLDELVIVIDTSGSCSGKLVKMFLEETWSILREKDSFFQQFCLHIIQCDCEIQEDVLITSEEEMEFFIKHLVIKGYGGTDFCPVFTYIHELQKKGEFKNLKGLIYFTDGYGIFPKSKPDYDVAFVVPEGEFGMVHLPFWAIRITIPRRFFYEH
jgi:predicted metal-dependent peptidase